MSIPLALVDGTHGYTKKWYLTKLDSFHYELVIEIYGRLWDGLENLKIYGVL